jgi:hypothetical protein
LTASESNAASFLKWAGGIIASVLTAVLIYYFTKPAPVPPPPVVIAQTGFDGFVQDAVTHNLLQGATMTLTLGQNSIVQTTDTSGKYSVVLPSPNADASMGMVSITATGYQPYSNSVELKPGDNYAVIPISAVAVPAPPSAPLAPGAGQDHSPVAAQPPPEKGFASKIIITRPPPNFVKAETKFFRPHQ